MLNAASTGQLKNVEVCPQMPINVIHNAFCYINCHHMPEVLLGHAHIPRPSTRIQDTRVPWPLREFQRFVPGTSGKDQNICFLLWITISHFLKSWGRVCICGYGFCFCFVLGHLKAFCCPLTSVAATENVVFSAEDQTPGLAHAGQGLSQELLASLALNFTKLSLVPDPNLFRQEPYFWHHSSSPEQTRSVSLT